MVSSASFISSYLSGREGKLTAILALTLDTKMLPDLTLGSITPNDMARLYRKELARLADLKLTRDNIAILSNQLMSITHAVNAPVDTKRIRFLCASPRSDRPEALRKQIAQNQAGRHCVSSVPLAKDESKSHELSHLRSIIQDLRIHSLVRKHTDTLSRQIREKVDPVGVLAGRPHFPHRRRVQAILPTDFKAPRTNGVCFRSSKSLRIFLNEK